jgi:hypothetical protein
VAPLHGRIIDAWMQHPAADLLPAPAIDNGPSSAVAVKDDAGKLVPALAAVELGEDAPTVGFIVDVAKEVERLHDAPEFLKRVRQACWCSLLHGMRSTPMGGGARYGSPWTLSPHKLTTSPTPMARWSHCYTHKGPAGIDYAANVHRLVELRRGPKPFMRYLGFLFRCYSDPVY